MESIFSKGVNEYKYSGFSNKTDHPPERLLNNDGSVNVEKTGLSFLIILVYFIFW